MTIARMFTAIELPASHVESIRSQQRLLDGAKWERQPHITLAHFGDVPAERVDELKSLVSSVKVPRLTISPSGFGFFPNAETPEVMWIGIEPNPTLHALADALGAVRRDFVGKDDALPFKPHITIARTRSVELEAVQGFVDGFVLSDLPTFNVERLALFASERTGYQEI